jgi:hypothetical protein
MQRSYEHDPSPLVLKLGTAHHVNYDGGGAVVLVRQLEVLPHGYYT